MATVSKEIADKIVKGNGMYPGDHIRVTKIVKYRNAFDRGDSYGMIYEGQSPLLYDASEWIRDPVVYWEYKVDPNAWAFENGLESF